MASAVYNVRIFVSAAGKAFEEVARGRWIGGELVIDPAQTVPAAVLYQFLQDHSEILWQGKQESGRWTWHFAKQYEVSFEKCRDSAEADKG